MDDKEIEERINFNDQDVERRLKSFRSSALRNRRCFTILSVINLIASWAATVLLFGLISLIDDHVTIPLPNVPHGGIPLQYFLKVVTCVISAISSVAISFLRFGRFEEKYRNYYARLSNTERERSRYKNGIKEYESKDKEAAFRLYAENLDTIWYDKETAIENPTIRRDE